MNGIPLQKNGGSLHFDIASTSATAEHIQLFKAAFGNKISVRLTANQGNLT
ncbi:MAG TPA: hypothetical protein PKD90_08315 [Phnomibacter sp.]|nr:hypothetical protein [Phnomibacter sp.]